MGGENTRKREESDVKHFHNNADFYYEIKHGGRFGGIGQVDKRKVPKEEKKKVTVLFGEELMRLR